jgi:hypothetical protein
MFQEEALRQKRLAAAATSRPEMTSSISTPGEALNVAVASPDQVGKRVELFYGRNYFAATVFTLCNTC